MKNRSVYIYILTAIFILSFSVSSVAQTGDRKFVVVIDPGHGGRDAGALGLRIYEKTINLNVALKLGKLIENNFDDVKVVYTRKADVLVELKDRAIIANKAKADLFISVHTNSLAKSNKSRTSVSGASTYTLGLHNSEENLEVAKRENSVILLEDNYSTRYEGFDPNSTESYIIFELIQGKHLEQSVNFASIIQKEFIKTANRKDMGVRQAGLLVLRETSMPAVLVELDFICNPTEEKYMTTDNGQEKLARSIYNAFVDYKADYDRKQNANRTAERSPSKIYANANDSEDTNDIPAPLISGDKKQSDPNRTSSGKKSITYKIQFLASPVKLKDNSPKLKGLSPVSSYEEKGSYKYLYGEFTDFKKACTNQTLVRKKFKDAFVVRFENGEKVSN